MRGRDGNPGEWELGEGGGGGGVREREAGKEGAGVGTRLKGGEQDK